MARVLEPEGPGKDDVAGSADFGTYLRRLRLDRGLSQSELAERANMSVEAVSALERGFRKRPQAGTVDLLAKALALGRDDERAFRDLSRLATRVPAGKLLTKPASGAPANHNLPLNLTSFVGRETEIAQITEALATHRLVTLLGPGGIGKTRTSLRVAANVLPQSRDGVWFVELAPLTSGAYIATTIAQAMKLSLAAADDANAELVRALAHRSCLLILDNCEHVVAAASALAAAIVRNCPDVRMLASSRQPLDVAGETVYRMPALPLPVRAEGAGRPLSAARALASPAIALFCDRAAAADPRFTLTDDNAATVAAVCERLDGLPLAIELAAPRLSIFTPKQLLSRLDDRFRLLSGDRRDSSPRQQTLRALIDWSYDLLGERERRVFRALGIFAGSFALEAASAMTPDLDEFDAIDTLAALTDKSLVLADDAGETKRFHLLESTRAYAREKLETAGESVAVARLHLEYLRDLFAESVALRERSGNGGAHEQLFAMELDDVRVAADFALAGDHVVSGAEMLAAINGISWTHIGHGSEGLRRLQDFRVALGDDRPALLARLCAWIAVLARELDRRALAGEASTAAVACARVTGDPTVLATALARHANTMVSLERLAEAQAALDEAERYGAPSAMQRRRILEARANLARRAGDLEAAVRTWESLREQLHAIGDAGDERVAAVCLSECEYERGNVARAIQLVEDLLPSARLAADWNLYARALNDLAAYRVARGDLEAGRALAEEATRLAAERDGTSSHLVLSLELLALVHARNGEAVRAARIARVVDENGAPMGLHREYIAAQTHEHLRHALEANGSAVDAPGDEAIGFDQAIVLALG